MRSPLPYGLYGLVAIGVCQFALGGPALQAPAATARLAAGSGARHLTFDDRVRAQEAIERVYYINQIGATKPFEEAVPREVLEAKFRRSLKLSVALERFWNTPVTAAMLEGETLRIARKTRMPGRLEEIYLALGESSILFEECYARQVIVDRLARDLFASDRRLHAGTRAEAERLREQLQTGALMPNEAHPRRSVVILRRRSEEALPSAESAPAGRRPGDRAAQSLDLSPDEFRRFRAQAPSEVGVIGPVVDRQDRFTISVVLAEDNQTTEVATFEIPKIAWSDWWDGAADRFDETEARQVVHAERSLPSPTGGAPTCMGSWEKGGLDELVSPRHDHSAVWTGTRMIVWGGFGDGHYLDTGSRYDPTSDAWEPTSTVNAPERRGSHSAVWTGTQMIIWSGSGGTYLVTGGRYDPTTDTWTPTATTGAPAGRRGHSAVWTGTQMIIWGGADTLMSIYFNTGGRYDPATDTWAPPPGAPATLLSGREQR